MPKWEQYLERGNRTGGFKSTHDNIRENKQFKDATSGLTQELRDRMHQNISHKEYSYKELTSYARELLRESKK